MKIIKEGKVPTGTKRFECKECGCIFEADKSEYVFPSSLAFQRDGIVAECKCPTCNRFAFAYE